MIPGKTYHAWVRAFVGETAGDWGTHAFIVDERACPDGICVESDDDDDGIDTPVTVARPGNVARPTTTGTRNPSCNGRPSCNGTPNRNCNRNRGRSGLFGRWRRSREASSVGLLGVMRRRR